MQNNRVSKVNWGLRIFLLFLLFIVFSISNLLLKEYIQGPMRAAAMTRAQQTGAVENVAAEHASKAGIMSISLYAVAGLIAVVIVRKTKKPNKSDYET